MFKITWEARLALIHEAGMSFSGDHISLTICNLVFMLLIQRKLKSKYEMSRKIAELASLSL
jgi:hypothetical protein